MPEALFQSFLIAVGGCAIFVWVYNRTLAHLHESLAKKILAVGGLPLGVLGGAWHAGVVAGLPISSGSPWIWRALTIIGGAAFVACLPLSVWKARWMRASRFRPAGPCPGGLYWRGLPAWGRPILRILAPLNQVTRLRIHRRDVVVPGLPSEFDGYRIVHLTDYHIHSTLSDEWYDHVAAEARALRPDTILFGGDFISKPKHIPRIPRIMRTLKAPDGVFFVRGNHDFWKGVRRITRSAESAGMRLLSNEGTVIRRGGSEIALLGFETPYVSLTGAERDALEALPRCRIGLVHMPEAFHDTAEFGCSVAFAGHTHGGQVRMPLFGTTISSTAMGPLYASGVGQLGDMVTITSNGQGAFFPLRVMCPPEVLLVVLRAKCSSG